MNYREKEIKDGVKVHFINTDKFKSNLVEVCLTTKLMRETVTKNALIPLVLKRGSANFKNQEILSKKLEEMYGTYFCFVIDKVGDNQVIKFALDVVNEKYIPGKSELFNESIDMLFDIIFNPLIVDNSFKDEYVDFEKNNLRQVIEGIVDDKAKYAFNRCIEEVHKGEAHGLFKLGYASDLDNIDGKNLYEAYKDLIKNCKIDIYLSGADSLSYDVIDVISNNEFIKNLNSREPNYIPVKCVSLKEARKLNLVEEKMSVKQGKLVIGLDILNSTVEDTFAGIIYNAILGGTSNSKLFQNVREKAHLAYVASSSYLRNKGNIYINCGIEINDYDKALNLIKEQIESIKKGDFSDEDIDVSREAIIDAIESLKDEQESQIEFAFTRELFGIVETPEEYRDKILKVNREDVIRVANKVSINTIYFLKN